MFMSDIIELIAHRTLGLFSGPSTTNIRYMHLAIRFRNQSHMRYTKKFIWVKGYLSISGFKILK